MTEVLTSLHGREVGLDKDRYLTLPTGIKVPAVYVGPSGSEIPVGRVYTNTAASAAVTNTTTETLFSTSYTLPANTLKVGTLVKIRYQGIATSTNATDTLAIKLYVGGLAGTVLQTLAARDVANNDIFFGDAEMIVRTIGASGSFVACGFAPANPNAAGTAVNQTFLGSTTIDTTTAKVIGVSAQWSVANAGNSCRLDFLRVVLQ